LSAGYNAIMATAQVLLNDIEPGTPRRCFADGSRR
jgi:hypothetical protein